MMSSKTIRMAEDFTRFPAGRYVSDGRYSGERFRRDLLVPALKMADRVEIELDGAMGYGSSFLEEAFGGLVRVEGFSSADLANRIVPVSSDDMLVTEIWQYIGLTVH
jgi:STAS-like domain of unknown function (DUF4325)